jgi:hypothetical protein
VLWRRFAPNGRKGRSATIGKVLRKDLRQNPPANARGGKI